MSLEKDCPIFPAVLLPTIELILFKHVKQDKTILKIGLVDYIFDNCKSLQSNSYVIVGQKKKLKQNNGSNVSQTTAGHIYSHMMIAFRPKRTLNSKKYGVDLINYTHATNAAIHSSTKVDGNAPTCYLGTRYISRKHMKVLHLICVECRDETNYPNDIHCSCISVFC